MFSELDAADRNVQIAAILLRFSGHRRTRPGCFSAGDAALDDAFGQTVLIETSRRFASTIKSRDDVAIHVDDLGFRIDPQSRKAIVEAGGGPCGVKRGGLNFVFGRGFTEIGVLTRIDEGIVASDGALKFMRGHGLFLILAANFACQFFEGVSAEEPAVRIDMRRLAIPLLALGCIGIENCPDRSAPIALAAIQ
jgi:hypothetical protein